MCGAQVPVVASRVRVAFSAGGIKMRFPGFRGKSNNQVINYGAPIHPVIGEGISRNGAVGGDTELKLSLNIT